MSDPVNGLRPRSVQRYGWVPDVPDDRDLLFVRASRGDGVPPTHADLRGVPPCVRPGSARKLHRDTIGAAFEFDQRKQGLADFMPSRLFIYFNERTIEGTVDSDSGP